jgi:hypothetical protein
MNATDVVWRDRRYEAGWYSCQVIRQGDHGRLSVVLTSPDDPCPIHAELVAFERPETDRWRARALEVITKPDLRSVDHG